MAWKQSNRLPGIVSIQTFFDLGKRQASRKTLLTLCSSVTLSFAAGIFSNIAMFVFQVCAHCAARLSA